MSHYQKLYPHDQEEHPQGVVILILGILGFFVPVVSFVAWYLGSKARVELDAAPGRYRNEDFVRIGRVLGIVASVLTLVSIAASAVIFLFFALSAGALGLAGR